MKNELDPSLIGNNLGLFKLEGIYQKSIFLVPKVYASIMDDGKEYSKIKGFKKFVKFNDLLPLLKTDGSITLNHDKWYKDISLGEINIKKSHYKLVPTENKRSLVYKDGILIGTKPYIINESKIIK